MDSGVETVSRVLFTERMIQSRLDALAAQITQDYGNRTPFTALAILHGSMFFMADLLRRIPLTLHLESLQVSSYHGGTTSSGTVTFHQKLPELQGRHVLLLDDILDSGRTLHAIRQRLQDEVHPASVRSCVLLQKRKQRAEAITADYVGFEIDDEFVVGYGLDYQGHYRNLPYVGIFDPKTSQPN